MTNDKNQKEKIYKLVKVAVDAISEKKGNEIRVLDISEISSFADYFIIASGTNKKQVQTISDFVEEKLEEQGKMPAGKEGYPTASWVLLDYTEFVVHIFSSEERIFYDLERIWKDGKEIEI